MQIIIVILIVIIMAIFANNLTVNLLNKDMGLSFSWLVRPAGFSITEKTLDYKPSDSYLWALFIGWTNSLKVIIVGLLLATLLGVFAGTCRLSNNILLKNLARLYVALIRQTPLLLQLMFWYFIAFLNLGDTPFSALGGLLNLSNQGIGFVGLKMSVEFSAIVVGLTIFTGASIAEVVRGGLNSVQKGQWEAFRSLGISNNKGLVKIIIPQALPAIIPGLTSQYLNLAKNSTLAIAVGYADIYAVSDTAITQTGKAIEGFLLLLLGFLLLNVVISTAMELCNKLTSNSRYDI